MNSPIGLIPFVGIAPSALTLGLVAFLAIDGFTDIYLIIGGVVGAVAVVVLLLLKFLNRLLTPEKLLSPL